MEQIYRQSEQMVLHILNMFALEDECIRMLY